MAGRVNSVAGKKVAALVLEQHHSVGWRACARGLIKPCPFQNKAGASLASQHPQYKLKCEAKNAFGSAIHVLG